MAKRALDDALETLVAKRRAITPYSKPANVSMPAENALAPAQVAQDFFGDGISDITITDEDKAAFLGTMKQDVADLTGKAIDSITTQIIYLNRAKTAPNISQDLIDTYTKRIDHLTDVQNQMKTLGETSAGSPDIDIVTGAYFNARAALQDTFTNDWTKGTKARDEATIVSDAINRYTMIKNIWNPDKGHPTDINQQMLYTIVSGDHRGKYDVSKLPFMLDTLAASRDVLHHGKDDTLAGLDWKNMSEDEKNKYYDYIQQHANVGFSVMDQILATNPDNWSAADQRIFNIFNDAYVVEQDYKHYLVTRDDPQWNKWDAQLFQDQITRGGNAYYDPKPWQVALSWTIGGLGLVFGAVAPFTMPLVATLVGTAAFTALSMAYPPVGGPDWLHKLYMGLSIGVGAVGVIGGGVELVNGISEAATASATSATAAAEGIELADMAVEIGGAVPNAMNEVVGKVNNIAGRNLAGIAGRAGVEEGRAAAAMDDELNWAFYNGIEGMGEQAAGGFGRAFTQGVVRLGENVTVAAGKISEPVIQAVRSASQSAQEFTDKLLSTLKINKDIALGAGSVAGDTTGIALEATSKAEKITRLLKLAGVPDAFVGALTQALEHPKDIAKLMGDATAKFAKSGGGIIASIPGLDVQLGELVTNLFKADAVGFQTAVRAIGTTLKDNAHKIAAGVATAGIKKGGEYLYDKYFAKKEEVHLYQNTADLFRVLDKMEGAIGIEAVEKLKDSISQELYSDLVREGKKDYFFSGVDKSVIKSVAAQSYLSKPQATIGAYNLEYKSDTIHAYVDENDKRIVISVRGTNVTDARDLRADASLPVNQLKSSDRYQYDEAQLQTFFEQYNPQDYSVYLTGHSLGGAIVNQLKRDFPAIKEAVTYNSALQPIDIIKQDNKNIQRHYTSTDPLYNYGGGKLMRGATVSEPKRQTGIEAVDALFGHQLSNFSDRRGTVGYAY